MTQTGGAGSDSVTEDGARRSLALLLAGNVLFAAGLVTHAFLFNFYLRELQLSPSAMGHQVAAMTLGGLAALLPAGVFIDRAGIRAALLGGVAITTIGLTLTALAHNVWVIYVAAVVIGLGGATCRVSWGPAIMRLSSDATRARAFTLNVALLIGVGSLWTYLSGVAPRWIAPLVNGAGLTPTQAVLLIGAAFTASALFCYGPLRSLAFARAQGATAPRETLTLPKEVQLVVPLIAFWMLAAALVLPFFNIYFADKFAMQVPRIGALFAIAHGSTALVLIGAAELAKQRGPRTMLLVWMVGMGPALLLLAVTQSLGVAVALYFVQGIIAPATNPLIDQLLLERAPRARHGIVAAWRNAAAEGAGAVGASAGGRLIDAGSFSLLFATAGVVAAVSAALLMGAVRQPRNFRMSTPTSPETT